MQTSPRFRRVPVTAALAALLIAITACSGARSVDPEPGPQGMSPGGMVLTQAEIAEMKVFTAMDILKRSGSHLSIARTRAGRPVKITARGRGTFVLSPELLLVVDGSRVNHMVQMLQSIPAESVVYMQILSGREAALQWGSEAANGVIVVRTAAQ
jgi:outer membrane cobalamin receptor